MENKKSINSNLLNSKKKKNSDGSNKASKKIKKNEVFGPFNKIDKNHSNNLKPKDLPSPTNTKKWQAVLNNFRDKNFDKYEKSKNPSNIDKMVSEKNILVKFKIENNESLYFSSLFKNNNKYKIGKLNIKNFSFYDINNKMKNLNKNIYNEIKIIKEKKFEKLINVKVVSLNFIFYNNLPKNSYKYKMGIFDINNFYYYDINNKAKTYKKRINDKIKLIDNTNKFIDKESSSNINILNGNNKNEQNIFISDIYYNRKIGLQNFGCSCYFNSFIQILIHIPGLIENLMNYKNSIQMNKNLLLYYLINFSESPSNENLYSLRREFIRKNSDNKYYGQEDSQEFGTELLKIINNELTELNYFIGIWKLEDGFNMKNIQVKNVKKKLDRLYNLMNNEGCDFKNQTIINYFFYYYEIELIICNNTILNYNYSGDIDNQLSFDKNDTSEDINLIDMLKKKYLNGNHKFIKLPIIFNITLLRAIINTPLIKKKVLINMNIDLKDFLDKDFGNYFLPTEYTLYALNVCYGYYKRSGHYYSYILINNKWIKFDDSIVREVSKKSIEEDLPYIYGIYYINKEYLNSFKNK